MVPRSLVSRAGNGGVAILPNTDTVNQAGMILVHQEGLPGLDVPYPEW